MFMSSSVATTWNTVMSRWIPSIPKSLNEIVNGFGTMDMPVSGSLWRLINSAFHASSLASSPEFRVTVRLINRPVTSVP